MMMTLRIQRWIATVVLLIGMIGVSSTASAADSDAASDPPGSNTESPSRWSDRAEELLLRSFAVVGIRYHRGGTTPDSGFDCSGLVRHVFREALGMSLPRDARDMSRVGDKVKVEELQPGDLVFFNTLRKAFSHVGIYIGERRFIHAPSSGGGVRVESMNERYWVKRYNGARRVISE